MGCLPAEAGLVCRKNPSLFLNANGNNRNRDLLWWTLSQRWRQAAFNLVRCPPRHQNARSLNRNPQEPHLRLWGWSRGLGLGHFPLRRAGGEEDGCFDAFWGIELFSVDDWDCRAYFRVWSLRASGPEVYLEAKVDNIVIGNLEKGRRRPGDCCRAESLGIRRRAIVGPVSAGFTELSDSSWGFDFTGTSFHCIAAFTRMFSGLLERPHANHLCPFTLLHELRRIAGHLFFLENWLASIFAWCDEISCLVYASCRWLLLDLLTDSPWARAMEA